MKTVDSFIVSKVYESVSCEKKEGENYNCVVTNPLSRTNTDKGIIKGSRDVMFDGMGSSVTFKENGIDHVLMTPSVNDMKCHLKDTPFDDKCLFCSNADLLPDIDPST